MATLVPVAVLNAAESVLRTALDPQGINVYRRRARALNADEPKAIVVSVAGAQGLQYLQNGGTDWTVTVRILALGRSRPPDDSLSADQIAGQALLAAHQALEANPTLGVAGLNWNNGFSMAEDDEDFEEEISAMVAIYEYQICTSATSAALAG